MSFKTSIVLCTYNEANYIENTIKELETNIKNLEIVIVDDSSTDGTVEILKKLNNKNNYKIIFRQKSRSLASAFARGMVETTGEYVGWIDTNMAELTPKFDLCIKELESNTDLVVLSRYIDGGGDDRVLLRAMASKYFNKFCRFVFNVKTKDLTSSIFLMKRTILDEVTILGYGHGEFFLEFLYNVHKKGYAVSEIPYVQKKDEDISNSKSAPNLFKFFYHGFMYFLRILVTILRRKN